MLVLVLKYVAWAAIVAALFCVFFEAGKDRR